MAGPSTRISCPNPCLANSEISARYQLIVDATTHALAPEHFEFEALGPHDLTGSAHPVELFRLVEPRDHRRVDTGLEPTPTALVGRTGERALLRALAERAAGGTRSAVLLRGDRKSVV